MLLSMTGFGEAQAHNDHLAVSVEVRTVNHRHRKISIRGLEAYSALEPVVERCVSQCVRRGAVYVNLRIDGLSRSEDYTLNAVAIVSYWRQLEELRDQLQASAPVDVSVLLQLPGVVADRASDPKADEVWPLLQTALTQALERLQEMRREEGRFMAQELAEHCEQLRQRLEAIQRRAPKVVEDYRDRLHERVSALLGRLDMTLDQQELIKEISIFAERSDVSEEVVRLQSHRDQFRATLDEEPSAGRKLDFLTQEMVREANTVGSKANDVEIAQHVVEIKGTIERMRELVQNVE